MMFRNILLFLLTNYCIFSAEFQTGDQLIVYKNRSFSMVTFDPGSDMRLSPFPMHQHPPLFLVTLPRGQRIIFLGTTHTFPLACMLDYGLARELIEQSSFSFNEINGTLLKGGSKKVDDSSKEEEIPEYAIIKQEDREKIEDGERTFYAQWYSGDPLKERVAERMATIFDQHGSWYKKSKLFDRSDALGQIVKMLPPKELHPAALSYAYRALTNTPLYHKPSCGGMDDHLDQIVSVNCGRILYALEEDDDRLGEGFIQENTLAIQESIARDCKDATWYGVAVQAFLRDVDGVKEVADIGSLHPSTFFADDLRETQSLDVLERDALWARRIMAMGQEYFSLASGYVGVDHLLDLFKKLTNAGCKISDRLSLAKLEELLLDEPAVLEEHTRLKKAQRNLRF